jgi:hypothetical protein
MGMGKFWLGERLFMVRPFHNWASVDKGKHFKARSRQVWSLIPGGDKGDAQRRDVDPEHELRYSQVALKEQIEWKSIYLWQR